MDQLLRYVLFSICVITAWGSSAQNNPAAQPEKTVIWSKIENGYQVQFIREADHEYILRTPLEIVHKMENKQVAHYAGAQPYGESYRLAEIQTPELVQLRIENMYVGMPLVYNSNVKREVDRFLRDRRLIEKSLGRARYFTPTIDSVLASKPHLPTALKHLPLVESNFKPRSKSRMGARGVWQFMRGTGRMYGLEINNTTDARLDPTKSTVAALQYLEELYERYNDWNLALAAYNAGPGRVNRAVRQSGLTNPSYWQIQQYLPKETKKYVPKFIAAVYVMEHADQIGLLPNWEEFAAVEKEIEELELAKFANSTVGYSSSSSAVPTNSTMLTYTVKSGDNLGFIAEWYDVSAKKIRGWNSISGNLIKPGQQLKVYVPAEKVHIYEEINQLSAERRNDNQKQNNTTSNNQVVASLDTRNYIVYKIKNGDTLWDISRKNGVSLEQIKQLNNITNPKNLKPGMSIKIREKS